MTPQIHYLETDDGNALNIYEHIPTYAYIYVQVDLIIRIRMYAKYIAWQ